MSEARNALKEAKKAMKDNDFEAVLKYCKLSGKYLICKEEDLADDLGKLACFACFIGIKIVILEQTDQTLMAHFLYFCSNWAPFL